MAIKKHKAGAGSDSPTADQRRARAEMRALATAWNDLAEEQRQAWEDYARKDRRGSRLPRSRRRTGRRVFFKANMRRFALGEAVLTAPPLRGTVCDTPLARLIITNHAGRIALKLRLAFGQSDGVMVSASPPCNAGVMACRKFTRIGLLPAPERGMCDITKQYVAKFGIPAVGKKVFISTRQMRDYLGSVVCTTSDVVPAEEGWHSET